MPKKIKPTIVDKKHTWTGIVQENHLIELKLVFRNTLSENSDEINRLKNILNENNLKIIEVNDQFIDIVGKVSSINKLFNTDFHEFTSNNIKYHCNVNNVIINDDLNFIQNILGLDNIPKFSPYFSLPKEKLVFEPRAPVSSFTPIQVGNLYNFPLSKYTGQGQTIAIIELGGGYKQSDLNTYFKDYLKLSTIPNVISIGVDGARNNPNDVNSSYEVVLDIEVAGAIAPGATIVVYFAPNTSKGFYDAIKMAITNQKYKTSIISISWGAPENTWSSSDLKSYNNLFALAVSKNINVFCASGDNGSSDGEPGLNVDFPASSPNVVGCGGTTLNATFKTINSEITWSGSGGGYSSVFSRPSYQNNIVTNKNRGVPDVAGNADPNTGYIIYIYGTYTVIGGTSAVSPLYSGLTALLNQSLKSNSSFLNNYIYTNANTFCSDIILGNNGDYKATVGWDACTGNGRIKGETIY
jgi:kumamolisin